MPSGSHRGGRSGSHSSGGSRSGGSFSSSRSFGGSRHIGGGHYHGGFHHYRRPIRFHFGRRYYVYSSGTQSVLSVFLVFLFFAIIFTFGFSGLRNADQHELKVIEEDYYYYQDMITRARAKGYIVEGTVVDKFYNEDADRYYIIYSIETASGDDLEGYTYSCYTRQEASKYQRGGKIEIAVDSVPITLSTDSVNTDYYGMPLGKDGEYINAQSSLRKDTIGFVICIIIDIALVAIIVIYAYKKKEVEEEKAVATTAANTTSIEQESEKYCSYCGSVMSKSATKCSSCGASSKR